MADGTVAEGGMAVNVNTATKRAPCIAADGAVGYVCRAIRIGGQATPKGPGCIALNGTIADCGGATNRVNTTTHVCGGIVFKGIIVDCESAIAMENAATTYCGIIADTAVADC
jgi:hypothetical protein